MPTDEDARLRRVLDHIDRHLDGDLGVLALSRVAGLSPHHFHRRFTAALGVGVHRYVLLLRLRRAAWRLAFRTAPVTGIALDAGFGSPEAFTRSFRRRLGQSPSGFRAAPRWAAAQAAFAPAASARSRQTPMTPIPREVRIVDFPETPVAILRHQGEPARLGETLRRFIAWRRGARLPPSASATFNIFHGDPATTPPEAFRLDLCAATRHVAPNDAGVVAGVIPGGRCAMLRHVGTEEGLAAALAWLHGAWLPASGERRRDAPPFCRRVTFFPEVAEHEAVTEIYLPLA